MMPFDRLRANVRQLLLQDWDPVGIRDVAAAQDEYDLYVDPIARIVERGESEEAITKYLLELEFDITGMQGDIERTRRVAKRLCALRER
jgi:hypothetical protein